MSQAGTVDIQSINPQVPTLFVTDSGSAIPISNTLEILGGTDASTTGSGNTITVNFVGAAPGVDWVNVTGTFEVLEDAHAYVANNPSQVAFSLPISAPFGATYIIVGLGEGGWVVGQNSGQSIIVGPLTSTTGESGSISSSSSTDSVKLVCVGANTVFKAIDWQGNMVVV